MHSVLESDQYWPQISFIYTPHLLKQYKKTPWHTKCCLYMFQWGALTSHNLNHSDLSRMERSRITQSHPAITWSRHATHSVSMSAEKKTVGGKQVPIAQPQQHKKTVASLHQELDKLNINSESAITQVPAVYARMTAQNRHVQLTTDRWPTPTFSSHMTRTKQLRLVSCEMWGWMAGGCRVGIRQSIINVPHLPIFMYY